MTVTLDRVATDLENVERLGNLKVVGKKSGKLFLTLACCRK